MKMQNVCMGLKMVRAGAGCGVVHLQLPIKKLVRQNDSLYVKVLRIGDIVLVNLDVTSLSKEAVDHFQTIVHDEIGVKKENVILSAAHSFSSPHFNDQKNLIPFDTALKDALHFEMQECRVGYSTSMCDENVQRNIKTEQGYWIGRNPQGYSNHQLREIYLFHEEQPFACILNYDMQSSCMMEKDDTVVSADVPGVVSSLMRERGIITFWLPGACADQMPVSADEQSVGRKIYQSLVKVEPEALTNVSLKVSSAALQKQKMKYSTKELQPHTEYEFESLSETVDVPLLFLKMNDIVVFMTSPELNSKFGCEIAKMLPERNMIAAMVNGANKYLPQEWDFDNITYMAMNTELARGSELRFLEAVRKEICDENRT